MFILNNGKVRALMFASYSSPFIACDEVGEQTMLSNPTRWRLEQRGRFPRRIRLSSRKSVYRRSEIVAWIHDPEGWRPAGADLRDVSAEAEVSVNTLFGLVNDGEQTDKVT
jgi:prophage regulatory protein